MYNYLMLMGIVKNIDNDTTSNEIRFEIDVKSDFKNADGVFEITTFDVLAYGVLKYVLIENYKPGDRILFKGHLTKSNNGITNIVADRFINTEKEI